MTWPKIAWAEIPTVSSAELRAADAAALARYGIEPLQLMEVAGWQIARFIETFVEDLTGKRVAVVAGSGNNGGDALCVARFLHLHGVAVSASVVPARDPNGLAARHASTIHRLGVPVREAPAGIDGAADVIVDGLFGTGIRPPLHQPAPVIIEAINRAQAVIVAIDVPSGIDADDATGAADAVQATATVTLAAPKAGLKGLAAAGRVLLADIGMPHQLFSTAGPSLRAIFQQGDVVELVSEDR